jgi:hypothetical protein
LAGGRDIGWRAHFLAAGAQPDINDEPDGSDGEAADGPHTPTSVLKCVEEGFFDDFTSGRAAGGGDRWKQEQCGEHRGVDVFFHD